MTTEEIRKIIEDYSKNGLWEPELSDHFAKKIREAEDKLIIEKIIEEVKKNG